MPNSKLQIAPSLAFACTIFLIYVATSSPGLGLVDSGELTTVAWSLGIAHPTGYPLYSLLGHLWLQVVPTVADRGMVLFSCLSAAIACGVIGNLACQLIKKSTLFSDLNSAILASILILSFGLSNAAWSSVLFAEVYPLTFLFGSLLLWSSYNFNVAADPLRSSKLFTLTFYFWGLSLGNHLTTLWFFPLLLSALVRVRAFNYKSIMAWILAGGAVVVGVSVNLFALIRSALHPIANWSDPQTISSLFRHLSAWQYRVWMFSESFPAFVSKLFNYVTIIPHDIGWGLTVLSIAGILIAISRKSYYFLSIFAVWLIGTIYNMNYSIPDISAYFLVFYAPLIILAIYAVTSILQWGFRKIGTKSAKYVTILFASAIIIFSALATNDFNALPYKNDFARNIGHEILRTLPPDALVLHAEWDIHSPLIYLQTVEKYRPDVIILDISLMQYSWYVKQAVERHPEIFTNCEGELSAFLLAVAPFESNQPINGAQIERAFTNLFNKMIAVQLLLRPVYMRDAAEINHPGIGQPFKRAPGAYFFRLSNETIPSRNDSVLNAANILQSSIHYDERELRLILFAGMAAVSQGRYALIQHDTLTLQKALTAAEQLSAENPNTTALQRDAKAFLIK
jgi:hypothetical protein